MLNIDGPELDFAALAKGMGVEAVRVRTRVEFGQALLRGFATSSPFLIDAILE